MERTYTVVLLHEDVGGYTVVVPALPGCFTEGDTVPEALTNAREAIECHVGAMEQDGERVPDGAGVAGPVSPGSLVLAVRVPLGCA